MKDHEMKLVLAPLFAMAGNSELRDNPLVTAEYARAAGKFSFGIARMGVRRACDGATWRPTPSEVGEACKEVLLDAAKAMVKKSMAIADKAYTAEQRQTHASLVASNRLADAASYGRRLYLEYWGMDDMQNLADPVALAKLLPGWERVEPPTNRSEIDGLIDGLMDDLRLGDGEGGAE